ncbi:MAG: exo-alpha-sialidase [Gemmatimonadetes bacterium]|nr:exo-alpha-sialidase [Gemmatimonadota bacterium]
MTEARSLILLTAVWTAGCEPPGASKAAMTLDPLRVLNAAGTGGAAPTIAAGPNGVRAYAWIGGGRGVPNRLFAMTDSVAPVELLDSLGEFQADRETPPKIATGPRGDLYLLYSIIATSGPNARRGGLRFARSGDGGRTWHPPVSVADDGALGRYRNDHALHVGADGTIYVGWLDQRSDTIRVYVSHSVDGGATWASNRMVDRDGSCECCRVAIASVGDTAYLAWRKILPGGIRDIVVARSADRGVTWSDPVRAYPDDWEVNGCPDAGPALVADQLGRLHLGWWTGKPGAAGVKYVRSDDGGRHFGAPVALRLSDRSRPSHVQLAVGDRDQVMVAWDDGTSSEPRVLARASLDGGVSFLSEVVLSTPEQIADYPTLVFHRGRFTVLWQEQGPRAAQAHAAAEPANVDGDNLSVEAWRHYNTTHAHQVVARSGTIGELR